MSKKLNLKANIFRSMALMLCVSGLLMAQTPVQVQKADLSIPFGIVSGKMVLVGDHLVFIDEDQPEASFAIARNEIQNMTAEGSMITVETRTPVRDRSGERSRFSFRLVDGDAEFLTKWSGAKSTTAPSTTEAGDRAETLTYDARHKHFIGSCRGKLVVTGTRISYEATDKLDHARQWQLRDIREVKQQGPYILEIEPYVGDTYKLELEGKGMDVKDYKMVVARIAAARVGR